MSKRKKVSAINKLNLDLADIQPLTEAQDCFFKSYAKGENHLLVGYPGTGKTFLSLFIALTFLRLLTSPPYHHLYLFHNVDPHYRSDL